MNVLPTSHGREVATPPEQVAHPEMRTTAEMGPSRIQHAISILLLTLALDKLYETGNIGSRAPLRGVDRAVATQQISDPKNAARQDDPDSVEAA